MKIETRTREQKYKVYVADDGTVFDEAKVCRIYESKCSVFRHLSKMPLKRAKYIPADYRDMVFCKLENESDIENVNGWMSMLEEDVRFSKSDIGTYQIFIIERIWNNEISEYENNFEESYYFGTPESIKQEFCDYIDSFTKF